jgi:hypothetical protein
MSKALDADLGTLISGRWSYGRGTLDTGRWMRVTGLTSISEIDRRIMRQPWGGAIHEL